MKSLFLIGAALCWLLPVTAQDIVVFTDEGYSIYNAEGRLKAAANNRLGLLSRPEAEAQPLKIILPPDSKVAGHDGFAFYNDERGLHRLALNTTESEVVAGFPIQGVLLQAIDGQRVLYSEGNAVKIFDAGDAAISQLYRAEETVENAFYDSESGNLYVSCYVLRSYYSNAAHGTLFMKRLYTIKHYNVISNDLQTIEGGYLSGGEGSSYLTAFDEGELMLIAKADGSITKMPVKVTYRPAVNGAWRAPVVSMAGDTALWLYDHERRDISIIDRRGILKERFKTAGRVISMQAAATLFGEALSGNI
jgi:hypothetical protein